MVKRSPELTGGIKGGGSNPSTMAMASAKAPGTPLMEASQKSEKKKATALVQGAAGAQKSFTHPYVSMMVDPLRANPVGYPDNALQGTLTYRTHDLYDLTPSGTPLSAAFCVYPGIQYSTAQCTLTAGVTSAWVTGSAANCYAELVGASNLVRVLAMVVEYIPIASMTSEAGLVSLTPYNLYGFPDVGNVSTYQDDENGSQGHAAMYQCVVVRPSSPPVLDNNFHTKPQTYMPSVVVSLSAGAAATTVGKIKVTRIIESVPTGNTLSSSAATVAGACTCALECAANLGKVGASAVAPSQSQGWEKVVSSAAKAAKVAVKAYMTGDYSGVISMLN